MKTENARTDRAKPIWPSDYSQAGHKNIYIQNTNIYIGVQRPMVRLTSWNLYDMLIDIRKKWLLKYGTSNLWRRYKSGLYPLHKYMHTHFNYKSDNLINISNGFTFLSKMHIIHEVCLCNKRDNAACFVVCSQLLDYHLQSYSRSDRTRLIRLITVFNRWLTSRAVVLPNGQ